MILTTAVLLCACSPGPVGSSDGDETGEQACADVVDPEPLDWVDDVWVEGCRVEPGPRPDCSILSHAVIECGSSSWTESGIRVAVVDDRAALLAGNGESTWLFHAGVDAYQVERLPTQFDGALPLLSQDIAGDLAFALSEGEHFGAVSGSRIHYATRNEDGWTHDVVAIGTNRLRDFELTAAGSPTIWYVDDDTDTTRRLTPDGPGWANDDVDAPGPARRDSLGSDDTQWRYGYLESGPLWLLMAYQGDAGENLGASILSPSYYVALPPARPPAAEPGPVGLVATLRSDGIHLLGTDLHDVWIPGSEPFYADSCSPPTDDCSIDCHEIGSGLMQWQYAAARAADGSVWVGWVTTQRDLWREYQEECDDAEGSFCACVDADARDDVSTYTLHLARVFGEQVEERLSLDVLQLERGYNDHDEVRRAIDLRAFDDRLAVGLMFEGQPAKLGLLEIDIGER